MPSPRWSKSIVKAFGALPPDPAPVEFLQLRISCLKRGQEFVNWRVHIQAPVMNIFHVPLILFVELVKQSVRRPLEKKGLYSEAVA